MTILKETNFFRLWLGQILSQSGARMVQIAILWWGVQNAGESAGRWAGGLLVLSALPSLLFVKWFGRLIDSKPARRILISTDIASGTLVALLALCFFTGTLSTPVIYALAFGLAACQSLLDPTLNRSVALVASPEGLDKAVAMATSTQSLANFAGAMLGALLIDHIGIVSTLGLASVGYFVAASSSALTRFAPVPEPVTVAGAAPVETPWQVLGHYPFLKRLLIGFGLVNFFCTPTLLVLPLFVKRVLNLSASELGLLEGALWLGLILGTWASGVLKLSQDIVKVAFGCLLFLGAGFALPAFFPMFPVSAVSLFVAGAALGVNNARFFVFAQNSVADHEKGRFFSILSAVIGFTFPVAYLLFGLLVDTVAVTTVMVAQGVGIGILAFYFLGLREEARDLVEEEALGAN